jgi:hypothetical protein
MNWKSRFSIEAVSAMVLVSFGGGFIPTASACEGNACSLYSISAAGRIYNNDLKNKITVQGCTQPTSATSGASACVGSKFNETIAPSGSWSGPVPGKDMKLIVLTAKVVPSEPVSKATSLGCTVTQLRSPEGSKCVDRGSQDVFAGYTNIHVLRCHGDSMECCINTKEGYFNDCRPIVLYPRPSNVPKVDVVCETLKSEKGVWTADPKSIKQDPDKKHCTEVFTCSSPPADKLSADERKCTAVISVNKTTTLQGACVDDKCGSCNVGTPNTPCDVSFRGSKP